jgi:hypothetical protein
MHQPQIAAAGADQHAAFGRLDAEGVQLGPRHLVDRAVGPGALDDVGRAVAEDDDLGRLLHGASPSRAVRRLIAAPAPLDKRKGPTNEKGGP